MNVPTPIFEERLSPSVSVVLALSLSGPMMLLAALPFGLPLALTLAIVVPIVLIASAFLISPKIVVSSELQRGRFRIPLDVISKAELFVGEEARLERGPRLDARARLAIRGDIDAVVKVQLSDPLDPTPYVVISTRRPEQLVAALSANRS